jgi:hypothetical protein
MLNRRKLLSFVIIKSMFSSYGENSDCIHRVKCHGVKHHADKFAEFVIIVLSMLSLGCFKISYPKIWNSHFTEKWFAIFGTSDKMQSNCKQSPKRGFLF